MRHGDSQTLGFDELLTVWIGDDPELSLVHADAHVWMLAHPCDCEALCECDAKEQPE